MTTESKTTGKRNVLVCGGAGYIGSHMVRLLDERGFDVTVLDNLSTGNREAVLAGEFVEADVRDADALRRLFERKSFDAVFHFSALIVVNESVAAPAKYYDNNVIGAFRLLEAMREADVKRFVFSSTAAVYGDPVMELIDENHPRNPLNPYGRSKLMVERMLDDYARAYDFRSVSFRYFNAAGSHPDGRIGEAHYPETHLIPNILNGALGAQKTLKVFGDNYPTRDGTCIRDYIHVCDLCRAHLEAVPYLDEHPGAHAFNLGNGRGFSVKEVIAAAEKVTGADIPYEIAEPREGDAAVLVADASTAREKLNWEPRYKDINEIIETAWSWKKNRRY